MGVLAAGFILCYYLPVGRGRFDRAVLEALHLVKWYAREHVVMCLVPAFFIAGAISVFVSQASVMKYLGPKANKVLAYGVASVSGSVLAVCSCTVLPLFAGIYRMGAGLGPAAAFLYAGPAINVLAIIMTARVLGVELGIARAIGAVLFSIVIGLVMHLIFINGEERKSAPDLIIPPEEDARPLWQNAVYFMSMLGILVFSNWGGSGVDGGIWEAVFRIKWFITSFFALSLGVILVRWFHIAWWKVSIVALAVSGLTVFFPDHPLLSFSAGVAGLSYITATDKGEASAWFSASMGFARQIMPLLLLGVLLAGALLGRVGQEGLIPSAWISGAVGGNSLSANFIASFAGAFMYFATLTEVPILQGLVGNGMGKGPALALLLSGPALSLPNMLVIRSVMGTRKTIVFIGLVIVMATISGVIFGCIAGQEGGCQ